jgi:hypothetical protein
MFNAFRNDPYAIDFSNKLGKLIQDFALNSDERPDLFVITDSISQLKFILITLLKEQLANIPIDRIEITSPKFDAVLEDLTFSAADIAPDWIKFSMKNEVQMGLQYLDLDSAVHKLKLVITNVTPVFNNLKFWFKKKGGFPKWEDYGVANAALLGSGLSIKISWLLVVPKGAPAYVNIDTIKVSIDNLTIQFLKAKHSFIDRALISMVIPVVKKRITDALADFLQLKITEIDLKINDYLKRRPFSPRFLNTGDRLLQSVYTRVAEKKTDMERTAKKDQYYASRGKEAPGRGMSFSKMLKEKIKDKMTIDIQQEGIPVPPKSSSFTTVTSAPTSYASSTAPASYGTQYYTSSPAPGYVYKDVGVNYNEPSFTTRESPSVSSRLPSEPSYILTKPFAAETFTESRPIQPVEQQFKRVV